MNNTEKLPVRNTASGDVIDTRPVYIEEWLDSLPYIDFRKTSQLLLEATAATNEQPLKPSVRLELITLYNRPYEYYIESQIKVGARHTLQSIETMQAQVETLKGIAINLARACKLSAEDTLGKKSLWRQSRPPLTELLLSMHYLSHALIFKYLEYAPVPKNIWRELNFIYDFAESLGMENAALTDPVQGEPRSICLAYKRIALASLADPHHLPYGAIWEIYEQLGTWAGLAGISKFSPLNDPSSHFVVKLDSDSGPIAYIKFNQDRAGDKHRLLDGTALSVTVQDRLASLQKGEKQDASFRLSPYFAKLILGHMSRAWGMPQKRTNPRKEKEGMLEMACGLNAAYYFLNNESEFHVPIHLGTEESAVEAEHSGGPDEITPVENYMVDQWGLVDQSAHGFAIIKNIKPANKVRVGDLVIINIGTRNQPGRWATGIIRWLMIRQFEIYKIGVQILSTNARPVAVRACTGSTQDRQFRRALLIHDPDDAQQTSIITGRGLYIDNREVEVLNGKVVSRARAGKLAESTTAFEQFEIA